MTDVGPGTVLPPEDEPTDVTAIRLDSRPGPIALYLRPHMYTLLEDPMTAPTTTAAAKTPRNSKASTGAAAPDFKAMAAVTREKLATSFPAADPVTAERPDPTVAAPASALTPGTLGLHEVPLSQTTRSSCNVRSHYDAAAIEELAASLAAQGQQQNATGRWNAQGEVEIVAGESRRRAQLLRAERGEVGADFPFLVRISQLSDGDALAISATENMARRTMTPLEECEAMSRLEAVGRTVEELAALFGYKTQQPVADRILVARNLHPTPRELLERGEISYAQAAVIARAPGRELQLSMTTRAADNGASAASLALDLTRGQFLVKTATFNVERSGLDVIQDLFGAFEPYFKDKGKAVEAQLAHARALVERRRETGKRAFVELESGTESFWMPSDLPKKYERCHSEVAPEAGTVFYVNINTGELREDKQVKLKATARVVASADGGTTVETQPTERQLPESAHLEAHQLRGKAAREAVLGDPHLTLAMAVWGLILGNHGDVGRISLGQIQGMDAFTLVPAPLTARWAALQELLLPITAVNKASEVVIAGRRAGKQPDTVKLLDFLRGLSDEELLGHLSTLVAPMAYNWSAYSNTAAPLPGYVHIAGLTGAASVLARDFTLTDEWLKRYPRHELVALAEEAGLGRALVEDCSTLKAMRGRILEHAQRLHAGGFVPRLVRFPEVKK
jgi:ParB/RepB/Spo0J family partition protein